MLIAFLIIVAPLVGAWIEISVDTKIELGVAVAPLVGAWIEIYPTRWLANLLSVAPLVGAWIEISLIIVMHKVFPSLLSWERGLKLFTKMRNVAGISSLLSWERGLKSYFPAPCHIVKRRSSRGSVD